MSREAFGDPPEQQEVPECCPNCGSDFYMPGCTHCEEVKRRCAAESEALAMRGVLHRMLEAPTTQISVGWKDAIRRAMLAAAPDSKTPNQEITGAQRPVDRTLGIRTRRTTMKILFLPSSAQRRRRTGEPMPNRLFLADGTELKGLTHLEAVIEQEWDTLESTDITASTQQPIGRSRSVVTKLTLTFGPSKVVRVDRVPTRRRR